MRRNRFRVMPASRKPFAGEKAKFAPGSRHALFFNNAQETEQDCLITLFDISEL